MVSIYLSSPVSSYQRSYNFFVADLLKKSGHLIYLPQEISPQNISHKKFPEYVYSRCVEMIQSSNLGLLLLPYGRDCAWEVGYYKGINKPLFVYIGKLTKEQQERFRDWMIKGSVDEIITNNKKTYNFIQKDPILKFKPFNLLTKVKDLPFIVEQLYTKKYKNKSQPCFIGVGAIVTRNKKVLLVQEQKDSQWYLRKKGMWGFPTTPMAGEKSPEEQSLYSLFKETQIKGKNPDYVAKDAIPNATGLFYKVAANNFKYGIFCYIVRIF